MLMTRFILPFGKNTESTEFQKSANQLSELNQFCNLMKPMQFSENEVIVKKLGEKTNEKIKQYFYVSNKFCFYR